MTQDEVQKQITNTILNTLKKSGLGPEAGVSAMMGSMFTILSAIAQTIGKPQKAFIKMVLSQVMNQI